VCMMPGQKLQQNHLLLQQTNVVTECLAMHKKRVHTDLTSSYMQSWHCPKQYSDTLVTLPLGYPGLAGAEPLGFLGLATATMTHAEAQT